MISVSVDQLFLSNKGFVVLLKSSADERSLPIFIGAAEAQAIAMQMNDIVVPRPLTHDLFKNVLDCLESRLKRVEVCELKDGTFYATLSLEQSGKMVEVDSRPSDAIALALRASAPIFVDEKVMDAAGRVFTEEELGAGGGKDQAEQEDGKKPESLFDVLNRDLAKAIEDERYEDAAEIRDKIASLKSSPAGN